MFKRGKKAAGIYLILLILGMTACGSQSDETAALYDGGEETFVTEQPSESPSASPAQADAGSPGGPEGSEAFRDMTVVEKLKTLTVEGCSLPIPCQVKDMDEGLSLGEGMNMITRARGAHGDLMYGEKYVGDVSFPDITLETDGLVDMSTGFEDAWIESYSLSDFEGNFEVAGVTFASTPEEIAALWGEPDKKAESTVGYWDYDEQTGEAIAHITFYFNDKKMSGIMIIIDEMIQDEIDNAAAQ